MARYTGPKNRQSRREGFDLGAQSVGSKAHAQLLKRLNIPPGQHGHRGRRKISDYGLQLREKQKVKRMYGMLERQFRRFFRMAKKWKGNTGDKLMEFLERRLDNVVYRMGLAPTRALARQLVSHGHVNINGKRVTIPSYQVAVDETVSFSQKSLEIPAVKKLLDDKSLVMPEWILRKGPVGKISRLPKREDINEDINEQLIIEFYSR
ncbi:30S ribosomal protein S4 [Candidatus Gottesmanbacteria bacterium RBG_16_52_11]|uniref:Small ribosomal subunit protein uS4 n=1 Tax=Candidatus Gottesmanbacteria bacterium RBG_16_52_11 TaxID=1798374 RepID=A0A1F5YY05_9BACT|nr:MAG: 30S ribosomal protein S4 [Candidatus Gottesmanbacteria bacterium RBG_16_52_11]